MTRKVQLAEGCTLRFPRRAADFTDGVEVGIVAAQMDMARAAFSRDVSAGNVEQIGALAQKFGFRLVRGADHDGLVSVTLEPVERRPRLRIVRREAQS